MDEKYVCIGDAHLMQKPKNVFIWLSSFQADMIILAELVIPVKTTHEAVVQDDGRWTCDGASAA